MVFFTPLKRVTPPNIEFRDLDSWCTGSLSLCLSLSLSLSLSLFLALSLSLSLLIKPMRRDLIIIVQSICPLGFACLCVLGGGPNSCQNTPPLYLPNHCTNRDSEASFVYLFCTDNTHVWSKMSSEQLGLGVNTATWCEELIRKLKDGSYRLLGRLM